MTDEIEPTASEPNKPSKTNPSESKADKLKPEQPQQIETTSGEMTGAAATKTGSIGAIIISILALIVATAVAYFGYHQHQTLTGQISDFQRDSSQYQTAINRVQQQAQAQQTELLQRLQSSQERFANDVQGLTDQMVAMNEKFTAMSGQNENNWLVDQAYYLLKIANNRMMFMTDTDTAIYLLNQVDDLLGQVDDPNLFAVRKKVSEDRQGLNARPKLDTTGLAIRVSALQTRLVDLPMIQIVEEDLPTEAAVETEPLTWYEHLLVSMSRLGDQIFTVRNHGKGYSPVISESDEQQLRFTMMMMLQTIQYAVLHHDDALFQANLLQLKSRLNNYFDSEDPAVQILQLEVEELLQLQVGYDAFEGLASLPALSAFILQRNMPTTDNQPQQERQPPQSDGESVEGTESP